MSLSKNCLQKVPDCGEEDINIDNYCYDFSSDPKLCDNFIQILSNYSDPTYIQEKDNSLLLDCIKDCHIDDKCNGITFSYKDPENNEMEAVGLCQLIRNNSLGNEFPIPATGYSCAINFSRQGIKSSRDCINVSGENQTISLDLSNAKAAPLHQKISTKYLGADCRAKVASSKIDASNNEQLLQTMGSWCQDNKDIDVCKEFCNNPSYSQFCNIKAPKIPIIMTVIFFILLFVIIIIAIRVNKGKIKTVLLIVLILLSLTSLIIGIVSFVKYKNNQGYSGTKKDYERSKWDWKSSGCQVEKFEKCNWKNPTCCGGNGFWGSVCKNQCPSYCQKQSTCEYTLAKAIPTGDLNKATVITGVSLWASHDGYKLTGYYNLTYSQIGSIPLTGKGVSMEKTNPSQYGIMPSIVRQTCRQPHEHTYNLRAGGNYALQEIKAYYSNCSMSNIEFIFADVYDSEKPLKTMMWPPWVRNKNNVCPPQVISGENSKCASDNPNIRWFIQDWEMATTAGPNTTLGCDDSGEYCGCYYWGLNRFTSVDFVGITS